MSAKRMDMHRVQEVIRLHRMGVSDRKISRLVKIGRNTLRQYRHVLEETGLWDGEPEDLPEREALALVTAKVFLGRDPAPLVSSVEEWAEDIETMLGRGAGPRSIYDALRLQDPSFRGSLSAIKRKCLRIKEAKGVSPRDVAIPVETNAGEVAQVDFGYVGRLYDPDQGVLRRAWVFVMTLGHSRHMLAEIVFDQRVETWLRLHQECFRQLGGVPQVLVPDNLKAAVIRAAFGVDQDAALNRSYRELARHYGFQVDPTPPRSPEKKGKVESGVGYIKNNFFRPREFQDVHQARRELKRWLKEIAGLRTHGTTGRQPLRVFEEEERGELLSLPRDVYELVVWREVTVHRDSHLFFDRRLYSVPWKYLHEKVWVRATPSTVQIHHGEKRIATHRRRGEDKRSTQDGHLPKGREHLRHRSRQYWLEKADLIGEEVGEYVRAIFDSDDVLLQLRKVQSIVRHLQQFPHHRARRACRRAHFYGNYTYQGIKQILHKAKDFEPLPTEEQAPCPPLAQPRFSRPVREIVHNSTEKEK